MTFFKRLLKLVKSNNSFGVNHADSKVQAKHLLCGIGKSLIQEKQVIISDYPFQPSVAFPNKIIPENEMQFICVDFGVCEIHVLDDVIFVSASYKEELKAFAIRNNIALIKHSWNWDWILEPYLDTEFTDEIERRTFERLAENGIEKSELVDIRAEVGQQMYKYNFDTMLWDWCSLGLSDVLSAMRAKYTKNEYNDFYRRALEIHLRKKN